MNVFRVSLKLLLVVSMAGCHIGTTQGYLRGGPALTWSGQPLVSVERVLTAPFRPALPPSEQAHVRVERWPRGTITGSAVQAGPSPSVGSTGSVSESDTNARNTPKKPTGPDRPIVRTSALAAMPETPPRPASDRSPAAASPLPAAGTAARPVAARSIASATAPSPLYLPSPGFAVAPPPDSNAGNSGENLELISATDPTAGWKQTRLNCALPCRSDACREQDCHTTDCHTPDCHAVACQATDCRAVGCGSAECSGQVAHALTRMHSHHGPSSTPSVPSPAWPHLSSTAPLCAARERGRNLCATCRSHLGDLRSSMAEAWDESVPPEWLDETCASCARHTQRVTALLRESADKFEPEDWLEPARSRLSAARTRLREGVDGATERIRQIGHLSGDSASVTWPPAALSRLLPDHGTLRAYFERNQQERTVGTSEISHIDLPAPAPIPPAPSPAPSGETAPPPAASTLESISGQAADHRPLRVTTAVRTAPASRSTVRRPPARKLPVPKTERWKTGWQGR